jgi:hypothetical protein
MSLEMAVPPHGQIDQLRTALRRRFHDGHHVSLPPCTFIALIELTRTSWLDPSGASPKSDVWKRASGLVPCPRQRHRDVDPPKQADRALNGPRATDRPALVAGCVRLAAGVSHLSSRGGGSSAGMQ